MTRKDRPALQRSDKAYKNWAGPKVKTYGLTFAGPQAMPPLSVNLQPNWLHSPLMSSWPASPTVAALQAVTRTVPIVFAHTVDPVGAGFVDSLARPGGNATGFVLYEYGIGVKWLELLKEIASNVSRVAVLRDPAIAAGIDNLVLSNL